MSRALFTWVGQRDSFWTDRRDPRGDVKRKGPILALLSSETLPPIDHLYLFVTLADDFPQRATELYHICRQRFPRLKVSQRPVDLVSVIDRGEIFRRMNLEWQAIRRDFGADQPEILLYLSPGTPQMQTVWVLLAQSGLLPARLIETPDPQFDAGFRRTGQASWFEVDLSLPNFPQIATPGEKERTIGLYESQINGLTRDNQLLRAELAAVPPSAGPLDAADLGDGFELDPFLKAQQKALIARAIRQADGNQAAAARLLGLKEHTLRDRADRFGIVNRRPRPPRAE